MPLDHMPQLSPQPLEQSGSWGPAEHTTLSSNSLHLKSQSIGCVAVFSEVFCVLKCFVETALTYGINEFIL